MALLPRNAPRNRIWQASDPEPADRPNVISLSKVRFHWDPTGPGWYRCDEDLPGNAGLAAGRRTIFPWIYLIESMCLVSEDTGDCCHTTKGRAAS
jgi:hypothetical protein